ncbi:MAG: tRNA epoxyqueuosine(34) reductase QueG [Bacteroidetes bacterium]|nr:MAG: tRNA epoxyqueuosine(34) reductase QueG [Bacteroidota bacterium]
MLLTRKIKQKALDLGFDACGISKARFLEEEAPRLEKWLKNNAHGEMQYMENHFDKRLNPALLVENAKSVISLLLNYYPHKKQRPDTYQISKYAYGRDYHKVLKSKMKKLLLFIKQEAGDVNARFFVDSAPVMDKVWAKNAGLGWIGKHSNLIVKQAGSFYFIGEIILDIELEEDTPIKDYCGTCTKCIDACPTQAITQPYVVDGSKCISYLTIELKNNIPEEFRSKWQDWIFGCDICQDVCPWNRFSKPHQTDDFNPHPDLLQYTRQQWEQLTEKSFQKLFEGSAVKRTKFQGIKRNIAFLK